MVRRSAWLLGVLWLAFALAGCGSGGTTGGGNNGGGNGGGDNGGGDPSDDVAAVDGVALGQDRQAAAGQALLTNLRVDVFTVPLTNIALRTARTDSRGRFVFSSSLGNEVPLDRLLWLKGSDDDRVVSGLVLTRAEVQTKHLNAATHIAALAFLRGVGTTLDAETLALYEIAARQALDTALAADADLDVTDPTQQNRAETIADAARQRVLAGQVEADRPASVSNVVVEPTQLASTGGEVTVAADVTDFEGDLRSVAALVFEPQSAAAQVVPLTLDNGRYRGSFSLAANPNPAARLVPVLVIADDGANPAVPAATRTVTVLPEGQITLDVLVETLLDEAPSRQARALSSAELDRLLQRLRPRVVRGGSRRRQVNSNQTIRNAEVQLVDDPDTEGTTDANGLLLLDVPLSAASDGVIALTARFGERTPYRQFIVLPEDVNVRSGDRIEVDLVLAPAADWQTVASSLGLGTLNFQRMPIVLFTNVLNTVDFGSVQPARTHFRPLPQTDRPDDGDFFATNLPAGEVQVSGSYAEPEQVSSTKPFGPLPLEFVAGQVSAVAALVPPGN